jgi:hypothetical protein
MSSPPSTLLPTDTATFSGPSNHSLASNPDSSQPGPEETLPLSLSTTAREAEPHPPDSQQISYASNTEIPKFQSGSMAPLKAGGRCYSRDELMDLKKSPLVAPPQGMPPPGMPPRKDWLRYVSPLPLARLTRALNNWQ